MKRRKICVVTGARADYSHLLGLMKAIQADSQLALQVIATGMHLKREHGSTYKNILKDGIPIRKRIDLLKYPNTDVGIAQSIGEGCKLFAQAFDQLKPDIVVIFADRFEMFAAASGAYVMKIPIAHIHGGETTQGAMDEAFRHSITKMASIHFPAAEMYRKRIIQLGENPKRVFNFGSPSLEGLSQMDLLSRPQLAKALGFDLSEKVALVTYHPVTLEKSSSAHQIQNIFKALRDLKLKAVFTKANADTAGNVINQAISRFCAFRPQQYKLFDFLGQKRYFSCLACLDVMVGNSSSGLVEAPSFKMPVINIGDRQKGRIKALNVIDTGYSRPEIVKGFAKAFSAGFQRSLRSVKNPYVRTSDGKVSLRIKEQLKHLNINEVLLKKEFYDLKF